MSRCERCPAIAGAGCVGLAVRRFCELVPSRADYRDLVARLSAGLPAPPDPAPPSAGHVAEAAPPPDVGPTLAGYPPCARRAGRWSCAGFTAACTLGLGDKGGIVDPDDCLACERLTPPETAP